MQKVKQELYIPYEHMCLAFADNSEMLPLMNDRLMISVYIYMT